MGRTATNVIGNSISTAVVASMEKDIHDDEETEVADEVVAYKEPQQATQNS